MLYNNDMPSSKQHKFFERYLDNNLNELSTYLQEQYKRIENGELLKGKSEGDTFSDSGSITTSNWYRYNVFQFDHPSIYELLRAVRSMTLEACEYYDVDFYEQKYVAQGWFNINYANVGKLNWHDHAGNGAPFFHGYYCVNAEPSMTHYKIFDETEENYYETINHNKNNRAVLSETGHHHAMGDWDWVGPRITMAYDVVPLALANKDWEQHWIPML